MGIGIKNNGGASKVKIDGINPSKRIELESLDSNKSSVNLLKLVYPIKTDKINGSTGPNNNSLQGILKYTGSVIKFGRIKDDIYLFATYSNNIMYQKFNFKEGWDTNINQLTSVEISGIMSVTTDDINNNIYIYASEMRGVANAIYKFDGEKLEKVTTTSSYSYINDNSAISNGILFDGKIYYSVGNSGMELMIYDINKNSTTSRNFNGTGENWANGLFYKFKDSLFVIIGSNVYKINEKDFTKVQSIPMSGNYTPLSFDKKMYICGTMPKDKITENDTEQRGCYSQIIPGEGFTLEEDLPFDLASNNKKSSINYLNYKKIYISLRQNNGNNLQILTDKNILMEVM